MSKQTKKSLSIFVCAFIGICPILRAIQDPNYISLATQTTPAALVALVNLNKDKKK